MNPIDIKIIKTLTDKNDYISGAKLGRTLNVSRNTIWKRIEYLRSLGYTIKAIPRKGYLFIGRPENITGQGLAAKLETSLIGKRILVFNDVTSTNDIAKDSAREGAEEGLVVIANRQSQGRGRRERNWDSIPGGLYFSILLRPRLSLDKIGKITLLAGISIVETLRRIYQLRVKLKWPNDVLIDGKKICGILTELSANVENVNYIVLGIGINCNQNTDLWSPQLKQIATSLNKAVGRNIDTTYLSKEILMDFERKYFSFIQGDFDQLIGLVKEYSSFLGQTVQIETTTETYLAKAVDINQEGALIVENQKGERLTLWSADVSMRKAVM